MLVKSADDKQPDIEALTSLMSRPDVDAHARHRIEEEIWAIRAGAKAEKDAAYEIEFHFGKSRNLVTAHDLRIECDGRVAQVDHLILSRVMHIWVIESKSVSEGSVIEIDQYGEWSRSYGRKRTGIASPIQQNAKHITVLTDLFTKGLVELPSRLGVPLFPTFHNIVLVSNSGRIARPRRRIDGLGGVIKVDQLLATIDRALEALHPVEIIRLIGADTLEAFGQRLAAAHVPATFDWAARFGLTPTPPAARPVTPITTPPPAASSGQLGEASQPNGSQDREVCASCGIVVSAKVASYSRANPARFGGKILCFNCQRSTAKSRVR